MVPGKDGMGLWSIKVAWPARPRATGGSSHPNHCSMRAFTWVSSRVRRCHQHVEAAKQRLTARSPLPAQQALRNSCPWFHRPAPDRNLNVVNRNRRPLILRNRQSLVTSLGPLREERPGQASDEGTVRGPELVEPGSAPLVRQNLEFQDRGQPGIGFHSARTHEATNRGNCPRRNVVPECWRGLADRYANFPIPKRSHHTVGNTWKPEVVDPDAGRAVAWRHPGRRLTALRKMAPRAGLEPATQWLTATCSTN